MAKLQKISLKKYFRHKDEEKKIRSKNEVLVKDVVFDSFGKLEGVRFNLHPKVEKIIADEVQRINGEPE